MNSGEGFRNQINENNLNKFKDCTLDELTQIALDAVKSKVENNDRSMVLSTGKFGFINYLGHLTLSLGTKLNDETIKLYEEKLPDTYYILKGFGVDVGGVYYECIGDLINNYCKQWMDTYMI